MAKGVISVEVEASTKKAAANVKKFKSDLEGSLSKSVMGPLSGGGMGGLLKMGSGLLAGGAVITEITSKLSEAVQAGSQAQSQFENLDVSLQQLARNAGSTRTDFTSFIDDVQKMAANGTSSFDSLSNASKTLYTAFNGNTGKIREMLALFDDLAAGTGVQVDDWASMASEVIHTGVSIKDLTKLSNKGIPIYQALGSAMGVTAEEAESLAKAGKVGTEDWMKAVEALGDRYKGLSQELSSNTLEGAKSTLEQSLGLANRAYSAGYNEERINGMNEQSRQLQEEARNPILNALKEDTGKMAATLSNLWSGFEGWIVKGASGLNAFIRDWTPFGKSTQEIYEESNTKKANELIGRYNEAAKAGNWNSGDLKALRTDLLTSGVDWDLAGVDSGKVQEAVSNLAKMFEDAAQKEKEAAEAAAARAKEEEKQRNIHNAKMKYGDLATKIGEISGKGYIPELSGPEGLGGAIDAMKKGLMDGTLPPDAEKDLETLIDLNKEYTASQKELADAQRNAAKAALDELDAAKKKQENAQNNLKRAREKFEDAEIDSMEHRVKLRQQGIYSGSDLQGKLAKMKNYNDWMALYDTAAADGVTRAQWRSKFGKAKHMSAVELENSGLFKKDMGVNAVQPKEDRAREELKNAEKEAAEANKKVTEVNTKLAELANKMGMGEDQIKELAQANKSWLDAFNQKSTGNAIRVAGTALTS